MYDNEGGYVDTVAAHRVGERVAEPVVLLTHESIVSVDPSNESFKEYIVSVREKFSEKSQKKKTEKTDDFERWRAILPIDKVVSLGFCHIAPQARLVH